mmetsp:Transcript_30186/g.49193  ORF Transcript_30186/g.49193 Transcript_30186/m.49193 type:complete len:276 (-) Transcript_30186:18-845(-)
MGKLLSKTDPKCWEHPTESTVKSCFGGLPHLTLKEHLQDELEPENEHKQGSVNDFVNVLKGGDVSGGMLNFIVMDDGTVRWYDFGAKGGSYGHSSMLHGDERKTGVGNPTNVIYAGWFVLNKGKLTDFSNGSGHFRPSAAGLDTIKTAFHIGDDVKIHKVTRANVEYNDRLKRSMVDSYFGDVTDVSAASVPLVYAPPGYGTYDYQFVPRLVLPAASEPTIPMDAATLLIITICFLLCGAFCFVFGSVCGYFGRYSTEKESKKRNLVFRDGDEQI